ncbi:unnamed protein product [Choristocarpus tenellus]
MYIFGGDQCSVENSLLSPSREGSERVGRHIWIFRGMSAGIERVDLKNQSMYRKESMSLSIRHQLVDGAAVCRIVLKGVKKAARKGTGCHFESVRQGHELIIVSKWYG